MSKSATALAPIPPCPRCSGTHVVRNGANASGTPVFRCQACRRRFVAAPKKGPVGASDQALVLRLLGERVGIRAIARITGRSRSWIQGFVNAVYRDDTPRDPGPPPKSPVRS
ncbi:IS1/IS1595 family N-terminal zinc-binding domain-containing protein [Gemmata palustris]|uniref:IS1/IS1595 family N-terminal zinc-binding domain-containing protein n=1 Tax=Gemmata palustris TaxID=2822762 RepID=UPI001FE48A09|nr:IS1 family transposase [Gemmata palustris]